MIYDNRGNLYICDMGTFVDPAGGLFYASYWFTIHETGWAGT